MKPLAKRLSFGFGILALVGLIVVAFVFVSPQIAHPGPARLTPDSRNEVVSEYTPESPQPATTTRDELTATTTNVLVKERHRMVRDPHVLPGERAVRVPVLMYHYVRPLTSKLSRSGALLTVTPEHFDAQMQEILERGYHTISPDDLLAALNTGARLPSKPVLITFDDGYRGQYTYAYPSLVKRNLRATFFVMSTYTSYSGYMTPAMMKEMESSGLMTLASHTRNHAALTKISSTAQMSEIEGSRQDMEKMYGHPIQYFAYPYGYVNEKVKTLTTDAGYELGFSTILGSLHTSSSRMELRRIRVLDGEAIGPLLERFSE